MSQEQSLIIVGASARAAAFSALRAGLRPWCIDLFADEDLRARCPVTRIGLADYPHCLPEMMATAPPGPWIYTGGLENHPRLVDRISRQRRLWGSDEAPIRSVRSPGALASILLSEGVTCPAVRADPPGAGEGRWLIKPFGGAGGAGIRDWQPGDRLPGSGSYFQKFIDGMSLAAVYVGTGAVVRLLGVTHQLVGESWLNARPFAYCGSVGPVPFLPTEHRQIERIGEVLVRRTSLQGLFGVDIVVNMAEFYPVEVNPRYTASVEVLEYSSGAPLLAFHRQAFDPAAPTPPIFQAAGTAVGKAILFARESIAFPADGPWGATLDSPGPIEQMPAFADIPAAGTPIERGWPVLTFFAEGQSYGDVLANLKRTAQELNQLLFGPSGAL